MKEKVLLIWTPIMASDFHGDTVEEEEVKEVAPRYAAYPAPTRTHIRPQDFRAASFCKLASLHAPSA